MIAYVESPFQYLQVLEYQKSMDIDPADIHVLVRKTKIKTNNEQIKNLFDFMPVNYRKTTFLSNWVFLLVYGLWICSKDQDFDKILIGDENSFFTKFLMRFVSLKRFIFLDDGTATLVRKGHASRFSMFACNPQEKNEFVCIAEHLKSLHAGKEKVVVIVGAKLVESKISLYEEYESYLTQVVTDVRQSYPQEKIVYIPHRYEKKYLTALCRMIFEPYGVRVERLKLPIELIEFEMGLQVVHFVSFFSTALFSLRLLYPESSLCYYRIPQSKVRAKKKAIEIVYQALEKTHIEARPVC